MKQHLAQISIISIILLVSACYSAPDYSDIPSISYKALVFHESETTGDSLILRFNVEDGDGNIGLDDDETYYPYEPYDEIIDSRDQLVYYGDDSAVPPFYVVDALGNTTLFSETDNRPTAYNCTNYYIVETGSDEYDTLYISQNEYHYNFHIEFLRKSKGVYDTINWADEFGNSDCDALNFNGRIPIFDEEDLGSSLTGVISYAMISSGFSPILNNDTFKLTFYIYDRALNKSNVVSTPDVTLPDITK